MSENTGKGARMTLPEYNAAMSDITPQRPLDTLTSEEMSELRFKREKYLVEGLLRPGLTVLAGSPKIGKSWLVLQLCMHIAKGEPFWGLQTQASDVLYLALEDSRQRLQKRVLTITSEPSPRLHFALSCSELAEELEKELTYFVVQHPLTRLIVIDTFQMVRNSAAQMSYANDYSEVSRLKALADGMNICILLIHHTRKLADSDRFNEISGTNGIAGSADTLLVLTKEKRADRKATLSCTGRDVEDLELELVMDKRTCRWKCNTPVQSALASPELPAVLRRLVEFMKGKIRFEGSSKEFSREFSAYLGESVNSCEIGRKLSYYRYELEDLGVSFMFTRTSTERGLLMIYKERNTG